MEAAYGKAKGPWPLTLESGLSARFLALESSATKKDRDTRGNFKISISKGMAPTDFRTETD